MSGMKLGAQLYTVRDYMKTESDFTETIEKISKIGFKYVQVSGIGQVSPQHIAKVTKDNGISVTLTHTSPDRIKNETEKVIEEHSLFGCDGIGIGGWFTAKTEEDFLNFTNDFAPAVEKIKSAGKMLLYHNHQFEFERFNGKLALDLLLENTDKKAFKLTFDTYWAQYGGVDVASFVKERADRIFVTHLKDMCMIGSKQDMTEVMTGNLNFARILRVCEKNGVNWHFIEQDTVKMDAFKSLEISYKNLMSTGKFE